MEELWKEWWATVLERIADDNDYRTCGNWKTLLKYRKITMPSIQGPRCITHTENQKVITFEETVEIQITNNTDPDDDLGW